MFPRKKSEMPLRARKVYFAHPINTYNTPLEQELLEAIRNAFMGYEIINPSDAVHTAVVNAIKWDDANANVMAYFEGLVMPCHSILVLPFIDGSWGAGVYREAEIAFAHGLAIWVADPVTKIISRATQLFPEDALSVDETRARIYNLPERTIRPYV